MNSILPIYYSRKRIEKILYRIVCDTTILKDIISVYHVLATQKAIWRSQEVKHFGGQYI